MYFLFVVFFVCGVLGLSLVFCCFCFIGDKSSIVGVTVFLLLCVLISYRWYVVCVIERIAFFF